VYNIAKIYKNTARGRSVIPATPGFYVLKNKYGTIIYSGLTTNLKRRIKEHHYDRSKKFSYISITSLSTKDQTYSIKPRKLRK